MLQGKRTKHSGQVLTYKNKTTESFRLKCKQKTSYCKTFCGHVEKRGINRCQNSSSGSDGSDKLPKAKRDASSQTFFLWNKCHVRIIAKETTKKAGADLIRSLIWKAGYIAMPPSIPLPLWAWTRVEKSLRFFFRVSLGSAGFVWSLHSHTVNQFRIVQFHVCAEWGRGEHLHFRSPPFFPILWCGLRL